MKRLLTFLCILMLVFFSACGGKNEEAAIDLSTLSEFHIQFRINPEFEITLDHGAIVQKVECLDEDAKKAFGDVDFESMTLEDALRVAIDRMVANDMLESGDIVEMQLHFVEGNNALCEKWINEANILFCTVAAEHSVNELDFTGGYVYDKEIGTVTGLEQQSGGTQVAIGENEDPQDNPGSLNIDDLEVDGEYILDLKRDENDHVIWYLEQDSEGNQIEYFYDGQRHLARMIVSKQDGYSEELIYRANGKLEQITVNNPDGYIAVTFFNENGIRISQSGQWPDGRTSQTEYDENGNPTREEAIGQNGETQITTFHPNGEMATVSMAFPNGSGMEEVWDENGICIHQIIKETDGNVFENTRDSAGNLLLQKEIHPDGSVYTMSYTYYLNGNMQTNEVTGTDGYHELITYYDNGNEKTREVTDINGYYRGYVYSVDGLSREWTDSWGVKGIETYHASNGAKASDKRYEPSGAVDEHYYNEASVEYRTYWRATDGSSGEAVYNADDSGSQTTWDANGNRISVLYFDSTGRVYQEIDSNGNTYVPTGTIYAGKNQPGQIGKG